MSLCIPTAHQAINNLQASRQRHQRWETLKGRLYLSLLNWRLAHTACRKVQEDKNGFFFVVPLYLVPEKALRAVADAPRFLLRRSLASLHAKGWAIQSVTVETDYDGEAGLWYDLVIRVRPRQ